MRYLLPWHSFTYKIACAPSEGSDQTARMRRLISLRRALLESKRLQEDKEDSDQSARMRMLTSLRRAHINFVGNAVLGLILYIFFSYTYVIVAPDLAWAT